MAWGGVCADGLITEDVPADGEVDLAAAMACEAADVDAALTAAAAAAAAAVDWERAEETLDGAEWEFEAPGGFCWRFWCARKATKRFARKGRFDGIGPVNQGRDGRVSRVKRVL